MTKQEDRLKRQLTLNELDAESNSNLIYETCTKCAHQCELILRIVVAIHIPRKLSLSSDNHSFNNDTKDILVLIEFLFSIK